MGRFKVGDRVKTVYAHDGGGAGLYIWNKIGTILEHNPGRAVCGGGDMTCPTSLCENHFWNSSRESSAWSLHHE